jgi:hypothetical protein
MTSSRLDAGSVLLCTHRTSSRRPGERLVIDSGPVMPLLEMVVKHFFSQEGLCAEKAREE